MNRSPLADEVRRLRSRLAAQRDSNDSDEQLLHDFLATRDESAFAVLMRRHGPMVLRVCRRLLGHEQDAEDAFQATFLVLARNAVSLRNKASLAGFLYGTAYRLALKAKQSAARRRKHEDSFGTRTQRRSPVDPADELSWREVRALVDEEIARLPEKYRIAFVLCCLESVNQADAARSLGLKEGTLSSRLTAARKLLSRRLARRGVELTAVLAAAALETPPVSALPLALITKTMKAVLATAAGDGASGAISASIAEMVQGATAATIASKAKLAGILLLIVAASGALVCWYGRTSEPLAAKPVDKPTPRTPGQQQRESTEVSGRVVDPDGKPVAGAKVVFHQRAYQELPDFFPAPTPATTGADGRFRFSAKVHWNAPTRSDRPPMITLTAHISGYGPAVVETKSPDELKDCTLRLVQDDVPIRGRILNLEGRPIAGVTVRPVAIFTNAANDLSRWLKAIEADAWENLSHDLRLNISFSTAIAGMTQTALTDRAGEFTLSGCGRDRIVVLRLDGPDIETCFVKTMTRMGPTVRVTPKPRRIGGGLPSPPGKSTHPSQSRTDHNYAQGVPFDFAAAPGLTVEGTVRDRDTGKPLAGIVVRHDLAYSYNRVRDNLTATTDADGNYRLSGLSRTHSGAIHSLQFIPRRGQPYFPAFFSPAAPAFGKPAKLDVRLNRGLLVKGRVTDKATGRPVQAVVQYFVFRDNPYFQKLKHFAGADAVSNKKDGSFALPVLAGPGILAVRTDEMRRGMYLIGQGEDAIRGIKDKRIDAFVTSPYMCPAWQFDTLIEIQPDAKAESVSCDVQLDPGKTVKGTILDPEGKPLAGVGIRGAFGTYISMSDLPSASFTIPAVNPRKHEVYFFEHPKKNLAAAVILKGDEAEGFTVKLKPTATITGRIVNEKGEPIDKYYIRVRVEAGQLNMKRPSYSLFQGNSGADGRFKIEGLLAGVELGVSGNLFSNLTLQPGEVRDLGEITIEKVFGPQP